MLDKRTDGELGSESLSQLDHRIERGLEFYETKVGNELAEWPLQPTVGDPFAVR